MLGANAAAMLIPKPVGTAVAPEQLETKALEDLHIDRQDVQPHTRILDEQAHTALRNVREGHTGGCCAWALLVYAVEVGRRFSKMCARLTVRLYFYESVVRRIHLWMKQLHVLLQKCLFALTTDPTVSDLSHLPVLPK